MKIEKIKQIKPDYHPSSGPATITTIGFKFGDLSFILGEVYEGQYGDPLHSEWLKRVDTMLSKLNGTEL
jgi:hypothetical protein